MAARQKGMEMYGPVPNIIIVFSAQACKNEYFSSGLCSPFAD